MGILAFYKFIHLGLFYTNVVLPLYYTSPDLAIGNLSHHEQRTLTYPSEYQRSNCPHSHSP